MALKRKGYDVSFKLKAIECAEKKSKEATAREFNVDPSWMSVIEGYAKCMVANKRRPGVDAWPRLNAGVRGVLKETNARALILGNTLSLYLIAIYYVFYIYLPKSVPVSGLLLLFIQEVLVGPFEFFCKMPTTCTLLLNPFC